MNLKFLEEPWTHGTGLDENTPLQDLHKDSTNGDGTNEMRP